MSLRRFEESTESFTVKIEVVEPAGPEQATTWRGILTHVESGRRIVFSNVDDVEQLVAPYLEALGVAFPPRPKPPRKEDPDAN